MTTLPRTTISPRVSPSRGTSLPFSSTTRSSPDVISSTPCRALIAARSLSGRDVVFRPRLADGDERRRLGQSVNVRDRPAQFAFDSFDRRGRGRRAGGHDAHAFRREATEHPPARLLTRSTPSAPRRAS